VYCSASCRQRAYERRLRESATEALKRDLAEVERRRADRAEAVAAELRRQLEEIRDLPELRPSD
jgi:RNA polymerase-interacting CarD/CdnL/TRCF family regulator